MGPLKNYKLPDGTTRQYREGEQPSCAVEAKTAVKQTPEARAAKASARRTAKKES